MHVNQKVDTIQFLKNMVGLSSLFKRFLSQPRLLQQNTTG